MAERNNIIVLPSALEMAEYLIDLLKEKLNTKDEGKFLTVALSGGSTPKQIFNHLSTSGKDSINWNKIKFFWVDERCVSPQDKESNYKMTSENLLSNLDVSEKNIFRIHGESDPIDETIRYSKILKENVSFQNDLPQLDLIILGMGEDGHTASIFPGNEQLFESQQYCAVAFHPQTGQHRITLTGRVLNNAANVIFIVSGSNKAKILKEVIETRNKKYPATYVNPLYGELIWLIDSEAANLINL